MSSNPLMMGYEGGDLYCWLVLPVPLGGPPRGACGCRMWVVAWAAWRLSFSDESALEVIIHVTRYTNRRLYINIIQHTQKQQRDDTC